MADNNVRRRARYNSPTEGQMPAHALPVETVGDGDGGQKCMASFRFEVCADGRCPIEDTLNIIAGRWKIVILWWLQGGELRFGELRRHIPAATPKMLTQQLRQMEEEGLVRREIFAQVPPKVIYSITERGQSLRPVLKSLYDWSAAQSARDPGCPAPKPA